MTTWPACPICGNTTGPCEHPPAYLYPEEEQSPTIHYASLPATEQRALAADIAAELARLRAFDDDPEPPW